MWFFSAVPPADHEREPLVVRGRAALPWDWRQATRLAGVPGGRAAPQLTAGARSVAHPAEARRVLPGG
eukprot:409673-Pyramimonas_sp.AAC.1